MLRLNRNLLRRRQFSTNAVGGNGGGKSIIDNTFVPPPPLVETSASTSDQRDNASGGEGASGGSGDNGAGKQRNSNPRTRAFKSLISLLGLVVGGGGVLWAYNAQLHYWRKYESDKLHFALPENRKETSSSSSSSSSSALPSSPSSSLTAKERSIAEVPSAVRPLVLFDRPVDVFRRAGAVERGKRRQVKGN